MIHIVIPVIVKIIKWVILNLVIYEINKYVILTEMGNKHAIPKNWPCEAN